MAGQSPYLSCPLLREVSVQATLGKGAGAEVSYDMAEALLDIMDQVDRCEFAGTMVFAEECIEAIESVEVARKDAVIEGAEKEEANDKALDELRTETDKEKADVREEATDVAKELDAMRVRAEKAEHQVAQLEGLVAQLRAARPIKKRGDNAGT